MYKKGQRSLNLFRIFAIVLVILILFFILIFPIFFKGEFSLFRFLGEKIFGTGEKEVLLAPPCSAGTVDLDDPATYGTAISRTQWGATFQQSDFFVNSNVVLCTKKYTYDDQASSNGVLIMNVNNIVLDCSGATISNPSPDPNDKAISASVKNNIQIKNCVTDGFGYGVYATSMINSLIFNLTVIGFQNNAVNLVASSSGNYLNMINSTTKPQTPGSDIGIRIDASSLNNKINNSFLYDSASNAVYTEGSNTLIQHTIILNASIDAGNTNGAVRIRDAPKAFLDNVSIKTSIRGIVFDCTNSKVSNSVLSNVTVNLSYDYGIQIRKDCINVTILDSLVSNSTNRGISIETSNVSLNRTIVYGTLSSSQSINGNIVIDGDCGPTFGCGTKHISDVIISDSFLNDSASNGILVLNGSITVINTRVLESKNNLNFYYVNALQSYFTGTNSTFIDSVFNDSDSTTTDVQINAGITKTFMNVTFVNTTFDTQFFPLFGIAGVAQLTVKWWLDTLVQDAKGNPLSVADVNAVDKNGLAFLMQTGANGLTPRKNFTEYIEFKNAGVGGSFAVRTYFTNYNLDVSKQFFIPQTRIVNLSFDRFEIFNLAAKTNVDACFTIIQPGTVYTLVQDLSASGTCMQIDADNVILEGQAHIINYSKSSIGYGVRILSGTNITIRNLTIFEGGTYGGAAIYNTGGRDLHILNNSIITHAGYGAQFFLPFSIMGFEVYNNTFKSILNNAHNIFIRGTTYGNITRNNFISYGNFTDNIHIEPYSGNNPGGHRIGGNRLESWGNLTSRGIFVQQGNQQNISSNDILANSSAGIGIYLLSSSFSNLTNNFINTTGASGAGILFDTSSNSNFVLNNNISTSGSSAIGISLTGSSGSNNIGKNYINTTGDFSTAISSISSSQANRFIDNLLFTIGVGSSGIYLTQGSFSASIGNVITTYGSGARGIIVDFSPSSNITNNLIITNGLTTAYGIEIRALSNNIILTNNNISASISPGLYLHGEIFNGNITNNTLLTVAASGIYLEDRVTNFRITNTTIYATGGGANGVYFGLGSGLGRDFTINTTFSGLNIFTKGVGGDSILISGGNHNFSFIDSVVNSTLAKEFSLSNTVVSGEWNFTNVTRSNYGGISKTWPLGALGSLTVYWYSDAHAQDTSGSPLVNVNISSSDRYSSQNFSKLTASDGKVPRQILLDYNQTSSTAITVYSNYTFNATALSGENLIQSVNISEMNNTNISFTFGNTPPSVYDITNNLGTGDISTQTITPAGVKNVAFRIYVLSYGGSANIGAVDAIFSFGSTTRTGTCSGPLSIDSAHFYYSCTIGIQYFDPPGQWDVKARVQDSRSLVWSAYYIEQFTLMSSTYLNNDPSISFGSVLPGNPNVEKTLQIKNIGNALVDTVKVNGKDLSGETQSSYIIPITNNFASKSTTGSCITGVPLSNGVEVTIPGYSLSPGDNSLGQGIGSLYICLKSVPSGLLPQIYSANGVNSWAITFPPLP